ncbi:MAG: cation:dicarboxylase symporter family transporter, partial [Lachnospiraceae bacterium]|nr:cation:dicarboxylase symporter family transporter [Lachnospiraceae bacterium]
YNTFFNILSCIAGPMIFLAVTWGIYGIGDAATLSRVGKRLIIRYLSMVFLATAFCVVCFPLFGNHLNKTSGQGNQLSDISELILGIFPSTIIEPFSTGNTLQIIFLAVIIGIALLFLGQKTSAVAHAIEQVNYLVQFLMELISRLVPFVIFLVVINLIWSGNMITLSSIWYLILIFLGAAIVISAVFILSVALKYKVSPLTLVRKSSDTFIIALATASSAASFSSNMSVCEKKYGINTSLCSFGIPLGMVMHKPISAIYDLLLVFYFAAYYNVSCSIIWLILAVIVCAVVAVATPPIPGGGVVAYTILFAQMGIPIDAMAVALTIDMLTDFGITAFEMLCLQFSLIHSAFRLNMIDIDTLRS